MNRLFEQHNLHRAESIEAFEAFDPQLRKLKQLPLQHKAELLKKLPTQQPGIYSLTGGRQVGKTTLLKQWMLQLLTQYEVQADCVHFLSGELLSDHTQLVEYLQSLLRVTSDDRLQYIAIDEVTYIKDWDKAIKYLADAGQLDAIVLLLSGSDLAMLTESRVRFPGRRGKADTVDFHFYPLSFYETLELKNDITDLQAKLRSPIDRLEDDDWRILGQHFNAYLCHGGYLTAINDWVQNQSIDTATLATYSDWIRGDTIKRNRQERYLKDILRAILKHYGSQVSWHTLGKSLSIDHHKTVADYVELLSDMDALFIQYALNENQLTFAPKKGRKLHFNDPFIYHAVNSWVSSAHDPNDLMQSVVNDYETSSHLVESVVATHFHRWYETYYIKAEGEVDVAYIHQGRFWTIEVKWRNQLDNKTLKQIGKYKQAEIWSKTRHQGQINGIPVWPLLIRLAQLG